MKTDTLTQKFFFLFQYGIAKLNNLWLKYRIDMHKKNIRWLEDFNKWLDK